MSPTEPWISAAGASARRMEEPGASSPSPPSSVRTVRRSASLSSERGRATELRSSPKARFGSDDSGASDADSNPRGERNWRPASPSGTVTDEETPRSEEEPVRRPRPSRASSLKGAASMSLWSSGASLFRSRRKSEATKLKREATRQKRRDDRFFGSSVGSAAEMNALVERSTSVSAFDGWLAAADVADPPKAALDEKTPTAPSLGGKPSNGGAGTASASTVHRRSESQAKKQVRSDAERDDVPSDRPRPSEISSTARRRLAANRDGSGAESSDGGGSEGVKGCLPGCHPGTRETLAIPSASTESRITSSSDARANCGRWRPRARRRARERRRRRRRFARFPRPSPPDAAARRRRRRRRRRSSPSISTACSSPWKAGAPRFRSLARGW